MDIVALVRPSGLPHDELRGGNVWSVQAFTVVGGIAPFGDRLEVAVPVPAHLLGGTRSAFAPPSAGTYLLLGMRPKEGEFPVGYSGRGDHARKPPPELADGTTVPARAGEVFGVALVRTDLTALPASSTKEGTILRALAVSTGRDTDRAYSAYPLWNRTLPYSAATWEGENPVDAPKRDVLEGMPALEFYRKVLSPLLPMPMDDPTDPRTVEVWALRTRWGVPGAADRLARALLSTVAGGNEEALLREDSPLDDLGNEGSRGRVGLPQGTMLELAIRARSGPIRDLALKYLLKAPALDEQRRLLPLLDDPWVCRRLLDELASWNKRPDLAPPPEEEAYAAKVGEIIKEWRKLLATAPNASSTLKPG